MIEVVRCNHSNERSKAVLSCGAVHHAVQDSPSFKCAHEIINELLS